MIKSKKLIKGDTLGIISPSSTIKDFPRRLHRGIKQLEELGFKVVVGKNARNSFGHNGGTAKERAEDINNFFADKNIKGIICSTGGWNANAVLPLLDYNLIKNNPKTFCGFSDITAINLAIYKKTDMLTFNGPTVLPSMGEFGGAEEYTLKWFKKVLMHSEVIGKLDFPVEYTEESLWWDKDDIKKKEMKPAKDQNYLNGYSGEGKLIGGNLITLCILAGTKYMPDFKDSILFLEEEGESTAAIERRLNFLEQLGILEKIKGLIFGRPYNLRISSPDRTLNDILKEIGEKYKIPIVTNVDCGHTSPMITLPIGINAKITPGKIEILDSAVN